MIYFIHRTASGIQPQSGYTRLSVNRNPAGEIWVLWRADKTEAEVRSAITGDLLIVGVDSDAAVLEKYPDMVAQKRALLRAEGARRLTQIAGEYCAEERETWEQQKREADLVAAWGGVGDAPGTPMLTAFAVWRGIDIQILAAGILENAALFTAASGQVMGATYALLDQVAIAADLVTTLSVEWPA